MKEEIAEKVLKYFSEKDGAPAAKDELLECDYLALGLLNSLQVVEMISFFEDEFGIRFTDKELTSSEFTTISGVIDMITALAEQEVS